MKWDSHRIYYRAAPDVAKQPSHCCPSPASRPAPRCASSHERTIVTVTHSAFHLAHRRSKSLNRLRPRICRGFSPALSLPRLSPAKYDPMRISTIALQGSSRTDLINAVDRSGRTPSLTSRYWTHHALVQSPSLRSVARTKRTVCDARMDRRGEAEESYRTND